MQEEMQEEIQEMSCTKLCASNDTAHDYICQLVFYLSA
jgi:hypothetical protein